jgi:hypothetical protein
MSIGIGIASVVLLSLAVRASDSGSTVILNESCPFHCYYRFATDQVSPELLKAEGEGILGKAAFDRLQSDTRKAMEKSERDRFAVFRPSAVALSQERRVGTSEALLKSPTAAANDWRDFVFLRMFFDPFTAPAPPVEWTSASFDDSRWVVSRPFQADMPDDLPASATSGNMSTIHVGELQFIGTGMHAAHYRARFVVDDPAQVRDMTLRLVYRGGARVFVNGRELGRGHLPVGAIGTETGGEDYPAAAYQDGGPRDRVLGPLKVPAGALVKGANVLAVEIRASRLHPLVLKKKQSGSWNALHDREGIWRHGFLAKLELTADGPVSTATRRPSGVQVWVRDMHDRVSTTEFLPPGEPAGTLRLVSVRNGTCSGQLAVGTDKAVTGLQVSAGVLKQDGGAAVLPASSVRVFGMAPFPAAEFGRKLGDERGLDPWFPDQAALARYRESAGLPQPAVFDQISAGPPASIRADACQPFWISVRVPADAAPGVYRGTVQVAAAGTSLQHVPIEVEVMDWRMPDPQNFQTFAGAEENPYGVAKQYGVKLWSDDHFRLLDKSFSQLGRIGCDWLNVPILQRTEFGNRDDSMVRWSRKADGSLAFDYTLLDRYLNTAVKHMGTPRAINFAVMHGMRGGLPNPPAASVSLLDSKTGSVAPLTLGMSDADKANAEQAWTAFAVALREHMRGRGLDKVMCWGYPLDSEPDVPLRVLLTKVTPDVNWAAGPHQIGHPGYSDPHYKFIGTVRYFNNWPAFRMDMGWKMPVAHLAIPRIDSSVQSLHTASHPFAFRTLVNHSLALGRIGFSRIGADEWAGIHYEGMRIPTWIVGMPVLFVLWPGPDGAESSARFEALLEGVQEGEARIFLEQALDRRLITGPLEQRARRVLSDHYQETTFFQNKLCIFELEKYHHRWQERSRELYQAAADVAAAGGAGRAE